MGSENSEELTSRNVRLKEKQEHVIH